MARKKILLLSPSNPVGERNVLPPLGLCTIAAYIPEEYELTLIDESFTPIDFNTDLAMISSNSITIRRAYELCAEFKKRGIPTVLGGIHASLMTEEAMKHADSVVVGNGEDIIPEVIKDFENGTLKPSYHPAVFDIVKSKIPRRDILGDEYKYDLIETARGCPFDCEFCSVTLMNGKKYRYKPLDVVRKDLESITRKRLVLADDNFFGYGSKAEPRATQLLELLKEFKFTWFGQTSMNIAEYPNILRLARESGANAFYIGFESINEDFLKSVGKSINLKKGIEYYKEAVRKIHDHGITIMGSFMIGSDYDTAESLEKLKEFIIETQIDTAMVKPISPLPGTKFYHKMKADKRFFNEEFWLEDPYPLFTFQPNRISMEDLFTASYNFLEIRKPLRNVGSFIRSYKNTKNLAGATLNLITNTGDYISHTKYMRKCIEEHHKRYSSPPAIVS